MTTIDEELKAMRTIAKVLTNLSEPERERVVGWLWARFGQGLIVTTIEETVEDGG